MSPTFQTPLPNLTTTPNKTYTTRRATPSDIPHLTRLFYTSFHPSHAFFRFVFPEDAEMQHFWDETFARAIQDPHAAVFVVEESERGAEAPSKSTIVALAWWELPSPAWSAFEWPDLPSSVPLDVAEPFFGGMDENREVLMKGTAHWCLELLMISPAHQGHGLGKMLVSWGAEEADRERLPMLLHATEAGVGLYKRLGFVERMGIVVPERVEYGTYVYGTYVRDAR